MTSNGLSTTLNAMLASAENVASHGVFMKKVVNFAPLDESWLSKLLRFSSNFGLTETSTANQSQNTKISASKSPRTTTMSSDYSRLSNMEGKDFWNHQQVTIELMKFFPEFLPGLLERIHSSHMNGMDTKQKQFAPDPAIKSTRRVVKHQNG